MFVRKIALGTALAVLMGTGAHAACTTPNDTPVKMLSAGFEAWKAVAAAMGECGNFEAELDQEFREKQPTAFAANPSLYQLGGVANGTMTPLLNAGTIRPLDDLVEKYGQGLSANQLIKVDGQTMAIAMMVNTQHLMIREDVLAELGLAVPTTWDEVLDAAEAIRASGKMEYPLGATMKTGWNLAQDFVNMYAGFGGTFVNPDNTPAVNSPEGVAALEMMKRMTEYMDPEFLVSDSTYVQQQFQQGKIAMANLWASRAAAMNDEAESQVVGKVKMAAAPMALAGGKPATTIWWDGIVVAANITDAEAEAAFKLIVEGLDEEMVSGANDAAIWLVEGYQPGPLAEGAIATAVAGPMPYPSTTQMGLMHTALGNNIADFLTGSESAEQALADVETAYLTAAREAGLIQ
ncbi:MAG: extracellular solute-binding protein [Pseudomonadota bacterium]